MTETIEQKGWRRLQLWLKAPGHIVATIGVAAGVVGAGIPVWQTYFVETPHLTAEIYSIDRKLSGNAIISPDDDLIATLTLQRTGPGFADIKLFGALREFPYVIGPARTSRRGYTPEEVVDLIARAKQELKNLPQRIEERQKQLKEIEALTPDNFTETDLHRLNAPISNEIRTNMDILRSPDSRQKYRAELERVLRDFKSRYEERLTSLQKRYADLTQLPLVERRFDELRKDLTERHSYFEITAVLTNSGRASTSVKQPALLRVYIGKDNYVDLKLILQDYQKTAEIRPSGTQITSFKSEELLTFPESDQTLIRTYWGQSVHAVLFMEDIRGKIHNSNRIAFAKGLYQKVIYDRLASEASKEQHASPSQ